MIIFKDGGRHGYQGMLRARNPVVGIFNIYKTITNELCLRLFSYFLISPHFIPQITYSLMKVVKHPLKGSRGE